MMTSTLMKNCQVWFIMSPIKVKFPPLRLNQKYQYPFNLQDQVSFVLFPHLNLATYLLLHVPAFLPTRLLPLLLPYLLASLPTRLLPLALPHFPASNAASSSSLPTDQPAVPTVTLSASRLSKNLRLEHYLNKIITSFDYSAKVNNCVIDYLKKKLKDNKKGAVLYIKVCFGEMLDDENFLKWLAQAFDHKLYSLKNLINVKPPNQSKNTSKVIHQAIYDFCVQNSITSNDSMNSTKE